MFMKAIAAVAIVVFLQTSAFAATLYSDNFNSYTDMTSVKTNWSFETANITLDPTGGYNGSQAIKLIYSGSLYAPFSYSLKALNKNQVYTRFKFKVSSGAVGGIKFLKLFGVVTNGSQYANWTWNFGPVTANSSYLTTLCYGNGSSATNDTQVCITPPNTVDGGSDPFIGTSAYIAPSTFVPVANTWYEVTTYNRYNSNGNSDGEMWLAVNGQKLVWVTNCKNRNDLDQPVIDKISFGDYSNSYAKMTIWFDDIEFADTAFPPVIAPSNLIKVP